MSQAASRCQAWFLVSPRLPKHHREAPLRRHPERRHLVAPRAAVPDHPNASNVADLPGDPDGVGQRAGRREGRLGVPEGVLPQQTRPVAGNGGGPVIDATPMPPNLARPEPPRPQARPAPLPPVEVEEPQAPPPKPVDQFPITVRLLYRSIRGNNQEELTSLTFREPTGGDINRCGNPCRVNSDGDVVIDEKKMTLIMANLSGVLVPLLDRMDPRDWNSCAYRLRNFFLPDLAAW